MKSHNPKSRNQNNGHSNAPAGIDTQVEAGGSINGVVTVPGDKSCSHRSVIFASLAEGESDISGFLTGEDSLNTVKAFQDMGVDIQRTGDTSLRIKGVGLYGLKPPSGDIYMGNAGTGMRLISGILAAQSFTSRITGDESLSRRPMGRVIKPLTAMNANIKGDEQGKPPLTVVPSEGGLSAIHYDLPVASAQVKSCVLLAGLYAKGVTSITEPAPTRDHTERMLRSFDYQVNTEGNHISLEGHGTLKACDLKIPADISSAAFLMVAASIAENSDVTIKGVGVNPTRTGIIDILRLMGADITLQNETKSGDEPIADIRVKSAKLKGIDVPEHLVPLAIDELPVVFVAAAVASGTTRVTGAEELRVKESDRIAAMAEGLRNIGVDATATEDGMIINQSQIRGGVVETHFDHRIAMSFCVAALCSSESILVKDTQHIDTSFPGFSTLMSSLGMKMNSSDD